MKTILLLTLLASQTVFIDNKTGARVSVETDASKLKPSPCSGNWTTASLPPKVYTQVLVVARTTANNIPFVTVGSYFKPRNEWYTHIDRELQPGIKLRVEWWQSIPETP